MKVLLLTFNCSYIHPNLALRWLYVANKHQDDVIIKEYTIKDDIERVAQDILEINPDVIGLSVYIWNAEITKDLIRHVQKLKHFRIIVGGPEVSFNAKEWINEDIEAVLRGEGEISFWQAVRQEKEIEGIYTKDYISPCHYAKVDVAYLESLESPYYLEMDDAMRKNRYMYFETSRGCPYSCTYCLSSVDNSLRNFSLEYCFKQLEKLKENPCKQVKFLDRTFNSHPKRALELAEFIDDLDVPMSFEFEVALEFFTEDLLSFFEKSKPGRFRFEVGVQTFNPDTLKAIKRVQNVEKLAANVKRFSKAGLILHTDLIAGLPLEDYDSFKNSYNKLFSLHCTEIQLGILKLLRGTKMMEEVDNLVYNEIAPYEVISTKWVPKDKMDRIKQVAFMTDRVYNTGRLRATFDTLFDDGYDIFEYMADTKIGLDKLAKIQVFDYFNELYKVIKDDVPYAKELLLNDYYRLFNEKPKALFERPNNEIRKALFDKLIKEGYDEHELNQYGLLDYAYYNKTLVYQLVIYSKAHRLNRIEIYDLDFNLLKIKDYAEIKGVSQY